MLEPELAEELLDHLTVAVAAGYEDTADIRFGALDWLSGEDTGLNVDTLRASVDRHLVAVEEAHRTAQASWPRTTDCDRLTAAFSALGARGILCEEDLGWCQGDAVHEMMERIAAAKAAGRTVRGYAFFHGQDVESAVREGELMIAFGRVERLADLEVDEAIGREVAEGLRSHGLRVRWEARANQRIGVELTWQRRRSG